MPYIAGFQIDYTRPASTLLRFDGTEYPGGTIVNKLKIPHERSVTQQYQRANNQRAFSEVGDRVGRVGGFVLDVFNEDAVAMIMSDLGRAESVGYFILEVPKLPYLGTGGRRITISFFDADFQPVTESRSAQRIQWHRATIGGQIDTHLVVNY